MKFLRNFQHMFAVPGREILIILQKGAAGGLQERGPNAGQPAQPAFRFIERKPPKRTLLRG